MKKILFFVLGALGLVVTGSGTGYWLASKNMVHETAAPPMPVGTTPNTSEKKPLYYYDPMYPQQKFDKPGKSPYMDMMLIPAYADEGADQGAVKISPRMVQNLGIRTAEVTEGVIDREVQVVGAVAFNERAVTVVQARVNGYIEKLFVRAPLDRVTRGQPLAEILAPEWVAAQEEYLALKNSAYASDALRLAARQRLSVLGMPESTIAAIDAENKTRPRITLTAPSGGVIGELAVREGMTVAPGVMLFRINGLSSVWINADVPELQVAWLRPGSAIQAIVPAYPGEVFTGRVTALLPDVSNTTRTLKARIEVANPGGRLMPGMFATINVKAMPKPSVLRVPSEAVIQTGTRTVVLLATTASDGKPQFTPVEVETGAEANEMTEIKSGLTKGARVVLSGQFLIDSEASLRATGTRMGADVSAAPSAANMATHQGSGRVEHISKDSVTLSHGPIPTLKMGAMTMAFPVANAATTAGLEVGKAVTFEVRQTEKGELVLTKITPTGAHE